MPTTITVPEGYGNVVLVACGAIPLMAWLHGLAVTINRRGAGVPYPNHYATPQQAKESQLAYRFNCMQRAHGQLLENMPQTMITMLIAGLGYPQATLGFGLGWMLSRLAYFAGYVYSSKPGGRGRFYGATFWFMQGGIWFMAILTGMKLI